MKFEFSFGCGFTRPSSLLMKKRDGLYVSINKYRFEFRRKKRFEAGNKFVPGEPLHWWKPKREGIYYTLFVPLGKWCIYGCRDVMSYAEYCGVDDLSLDWILDEFDASFNRLAAASLKYHLELSICDNEPRRAVYEDLIERLLEKEPQFTEEERAIIYPPGWKPEDDFIEYPDGSVGLKEPTPDERAVYAAMREREAAYLERINKARHDFVDIMPYLWS